MKKLLPLLLAAILVLTGCSQEEAALSPSPSAAPTATEPAPTATPEPTVEPTPEPTPEPIRNPLTGETVDAAVTTRPYAVMINNISVAQPQCGVSQADIIYEVLAEGGITRMLAIFSDISGAGAIGSMRSARPYYLDIAMTYNAIFVHAGGSEQAYADISTYGIDNMDGVRGAYGGEIFYRDPNRMSAGYEHSLFTTADLLLQYTQVLGFETQQAEGWDYGLSFTEDATPAGGYSAANLDVNFGGWKDTAFRYDAASGTYIMSQYGSDYIDGNTGETLGFENVLVLYADTYTLDGEGRLSVTLTGSGSGHFACGGQAADITWSRAGTGEAFQYTYADGSEVSLGVGTTYICIVPTGSSTVSFS